MIHAQFYFFKNQKGQIRTVYKTEHCIFDSYGWKKGFDTFSSLH